jgi:hypothetical protein
VRRASEYGPASQFNTRVRISASMFTIRQRDRLTERLLEIARQDRRVVAAAQIGSIAEGGGDRWSDLDLTFGIVNDIDVTDVLEDWTTQLEEEHGAVQLFDVSYLSTIYRVFLLPGSLQVDLSFTPASEFGALGPKFQLLFGNTVERDPPADPSANDLFGLGAHHAVRARICIERGRWWQAEYWISGVRDQALSLACARRGLEQSYGRGFDQLPPEVLDSLEGALVKSLTRDELLRALRTAIEGLLAESNDVRAAHKVKAQLRELGSTGSR